jgi:hypothetical protein
MRPGQIPAAIEKRLAPLMPVGVIEYHGLGRAAAARRSGGGERQAVSV